MSAFKVAAHFLVKDEADVVKECIYGVAAYCDYIFVLDNGSSDGTYEICRDHPKVTWVDQIDCTYSDALRQHLIEASKSYLSNDDWFLALSSDHFFDSDPRQDIERALAEKANVITYDVAQFYFTDVDYAASQNAGWTDLPVQERLRYYAINYSGFPVTLQYDRTMVYREDVTEWPVMNSRRIASFSPLLKHYQFRSVEQIQRRLEVRQQQIANGFGGFRHYRSYDWKDYVVDSNKLHHYNGTWLRAKKPSLDDLLGFEPPLIEKMKSTFYTYARKVRRSLK